MLIQLGRYVVTDTLIKCADTIYFNIDTRTDSVFRYRDIVHIQIHLLCARIQYISLLLCAQKQCILLCFDTKLLKRFIIKQNLSIFRNSGTNNASL